MLKRDLTKYKFNDQFYGKGRLVQAIIIDFCSKRKSMTLDQLQNIFTKNLCGKYEIVEDVKIIKKGHRDARYFMDQLIILKDGTKCAITSQWGSGNIDNILHLFKKYYGYKFRKV